MMEVEDKEAVCSYCGYPWLSLPVKRVRVETSRLRSGCGAMTSTFELAEPCDRRGHYLILV
jgi:hypothetical protein